MVQITRIYTRSGDKGRTALGDGTRRKKSDIRFETIGAIDEVNAYCGLVATEVPATVCKLIRRIQNDLFDLGADLAVPHGEGLRVGIKQVEFLEKQIDKFNATLEPLDSFEQLPDAQNAAWCY
jgi:cob(I)alamin adenosyltransferase